MKRSEVEEYVDHASSIIEQSPQMDEENTKAKVIRPLIELLGWDIYSSVELEFPVQMGSTQKRVDYALILDDSPVVFIEVKGYDSVISDSEYQQLKSYMRQVGVDWGFLANGKEFGILKRKKDQKNPEEIVLGKFSLDELEDNFSLLQVLTKESIESGESEKAAEKIQQRKEAIKKLRKEKEEIVNEITEVISKKSSKTITQDVEEKSKEFIEELISSLKTSQKEDSQSADIEGETTAVDEKIKIQLQNAWKDYPLIPIPNDKRRFFPGYKESFILKTDIGDIETHVSSAPKGTKEGDPEAGEYIRKGMSKWQKKHSEIEGGDWITIEKISNKKYRLKKS